MLASGHALFSIFIALLIFLGTGIKVSILALIICLIGGIFPDIDEEKSVITKKTGPIGWVISRLFSHRGIFHSLLGAAIITFLIFLVFKIFNLGFLALWFLVGYISHLIADSFTIAGVAWLHPFSSSLTRGKLRVGSFWEKVFTLILMIVVIILLMKLEGYI